MSFCSGIRVSAYDASTVEVVRRYLPEGDFRRIVIKPNWVRHASNQDFPLEAMVTDATLVEAVIDACIAKYPRAAEILVGDAPLQGCDWDLLVNQAGIARLIAKYRQSEAPRVRFRDLRANRVRVKDGYIETRETALEGDPRGYRDVVLDATSFLEEISESGDRFRVADYSPDETISNHHRGFHRYTVSASVLSADLVINVPKMKCHQKAGVTGALKNMVGINGNKANLVHYRHGLSGVGSDEFPPHRSLAVVAQVRVRKVAERAPRWIFYPLRWGWRALRTLIGIEVQGTRANLEKKFFVSGGSWYGNDTIWRMIYDLNRIVLYAPSEGGRLRTSPQRRYLAILDGLIGGEGNGPLQPLPVATGLLMFADDPFLMDMAMATMMGFDWRKIPSLQHYRDFPGQQWGGFDPDAVRVELDRRPYEGVASLPVLKAFLPSPGWKGHIEREVTHHAVA